MSSQIFFQRQQEPWKLCGDKEQSCLFNLYWVFQLVFSLLIHKGWKILINGKTEWWHLHVWFLRSTGGWSSDLGSQGQQGDADSITEIHTRSFVHQAFLISGAPHIYSYWTHITLWKQPDTDTANNAGLILQHSPHVIWTHSAPNSRVSFSYLFLLNSDQLQSTINSTKVFKFFFLINFMHTFIGN